MLFAEKYLLRLRFKIPDTVAIKVAYQKRNQMDIIATTAVSVYNDLELKSNKLSFNLRRNIARVYVDK